MMEELYAELGAVRLEHPIWKLPGFGIGALKAITAGAGSLVKTLQQPGEET